MKTEISATLWAHMALERTICYLLLRLVCLRDSLLSVLLLVAIWLFDRLPKKTCVRDDLLSVK